MTNRLLSHHDLASLGRCLTVVLALTSIVGCGDDPESELDNLVERVWMEDFPHKDAIEFLEAGGTHYDTRYGHHENVDQQYVIPLLKRLSDETNVEPLAFVDEDLNWAWALIIRLPSDESAHSQIQSLIDAADTEFPGIIETEWGHQTLRLSFVDQSEG